MMTESNQSSGHREYLRQRAQAYKAELELILGSAKYQISTGREHCSGCDPRFKYLLTPEKTCNNMLLKDQVT